MPEKSHSQVPTLENPRGTTPARQAPTRLKSASSRRRMQRGQGGEGKNTRARCRSIDDSPHGWASTQREDSPNLAHPSFRKRVTSMNERDGLGWPAQRVEPRFIQSHNRSRTAFISRKEQDVRGQRRHSAEGNDHGKARLSDSKQNTADSKRCQAMETHKAG